MTYYCDKHNQAYELHCPACPPDRKAGHAGAYYPPPITVTQIYGTSHPPCPIGYEFLTGPGSFRPPKDKESFLATASCTNYVCDGLEKIADLYEPRLILRKLPEVVPDSITVLKDQIARLTKERDYYKKYFDGTY